MAIDRNNLARASELNDESVRLGHQLAVAQSNARITSMTMVLPGEAVGEMAVPDLIETIDTGYMVSPPQMIDAIRTQIQSRKDQIDAELAALGVTT